MQLGKICDHDTLRAFPLFAGLNESQIALLAGMFRPCRAADGQTIMSADEPGGAAFIVQSGFVRVHVEQEDGSDIVLAILGPGELVGEMSLVDQLARSAAVVALGPATLLAIDRATFWSCLRSMPIMGFNLASILSRRLRLANAHIQSLAALGVPGRVAYQLSVLAREYGVSGSDGGILIPFRLSQSDLAGLVGASRVRVNQVLMDYRREGLLRIDRDRRVVLCNAPALASRIMSTR
jgi:CRP/FNR family cyclic AMP-dependent transcriptional regulator